MKWSFVALLFIANVVVVVLGEQHLENQASAAGGYIPARTDVSVGESVYADKP